MSQETIIKRGEYQCENGANIVSMEKPTINIVVIGHTDVGKCVSLSV